MARRTSRKRADRAIVLVLVLWIVMILTMMAYSLLFQVSLQASMTGTRKKMLQAEALSRAGIAKAIVDLRNDMLFDSSDEEGRIFDAEGDIWARPEEGKDEVYLSRDGEDKNQYFSVRVFDEEGLFNINSFRGTNMILLQEILKELGLEEKDAEIVACAIIDWADTDDLPTLPNAPFNEEGIAYSILKGEATDGEVDPEEVEPLKFRNEAYVSIAELLEVYGVTPELYFGPDTEEAQYYRDRYPNRWNFDMELDPPRRSRAREEAPLGLRDYFTVFGAGRLNMNTAPPHVLSAFARAAGQPDGESFAENVIRARRGGASDRNIDNDNAFKSDQDLLSREFGGVISVGQNLYSVGVESSFFQIISEGHSGEIIVRLEATVARNMANLQREEDFEAIDRARERKDRNSGRWERRQNQDNELLVRYPMITVIQTRRN